MGFEPPTTALEGRRSTPELLPLTGFRLRVILYQGAEAQSTIRALSVTRGIGTEVQKI